MPFGLCNFPATYQLLMTFSLREELFELAFVYLDDVMIYSKYIPEHLTRLGRLFQKVKQSGVKLEQPQRNRKNIKLGKKWTSNCIQAFESLKIALTQAPVLGFADYSLPFILETDASSTGLGAVLSQKQDGRLRVIAYASRGLRGPEKSMENSQ